MDLDQDDVIVQRRMRAKMEFPVAALAGNETPGDVALQTLLNTHRGACRIAGLGDVGEPRASQCVTGSRCGDWR